MMIVKILILLQEIILAIVSLLKVIVCIIKILQGKAWKKLTNTDKEILLILFIAIVCIAVILTV